jgi:hypothetical protein
MFDLPYMATHPVLAQIMKHCATLSEEAEGLPPGSPTRKKLDRRITELEQYRLPKPDARDLKESEPIQWLIRPLAAETSAGTFRTLSGTRD